MKRSLFVLSALAIVGSANAVELILNGGFEDAGGPLTSWGSTSSHDPTGNAGAYGAAHAGANHVYMGGWGASTVEIATITQTVAIASGNTAMLSFWMLRLGGDQSPATYNVKINGNSLQGGLVSTLPDYNVGGTALYMQFTHNVSSYAGGNATVEFSFNKAAAQTDANLFIDDVSIMAEPVPEPATILAMVGGVALLALRRRK